MNREAIYSALFDLAGGAHGIVYKSRRIKSFADVAVGDTPALFMEQKGEAAAVQTRMPARWTLSVDLVVYINIGNGSDVVPTTILNPILDAITSKLIPPAAMGEQTLGGLVERCRVDGQIEIVEGAQGETALAIIPIIIYLPE